MSLKRRPAFRALLLLALLLIIPIAAAGQTSSNTAFRFRRGDTLPATCSVADVFYVTPGVAGTIQQYNCTDTNTWTIVTSGGGGGGSPGGINTQVQFNDSGTFGGDAGLTFNKTTNVLTISGGGVVLSTSTINKLTITAPATGATLTIADGKTLTANNTLTFTGTDSSSVAFGAGGTVLYTTGDGSGLTFPGSLSIASGKTFTASNTLTLTGTDSSTVAFGAGGTVVYTGRTISTTSPLGGGGDLSANRTFTCTTCTTNASALTANLPVIGVGGQATAVGTRSGNTTQFVTTTGTLTSGDCVKIDANGNFIANGSACGGGGGTPGGSDTQVQFNDSGSFGGDAGLTYAKSTDVLSITGPIKSSATGFGSGNTGAAYQLGTNGAGLGIATADEPYLTTKNNGVIYFGGASGTQFIMNTQNTVFQFGGDVSIGRNSSTALEINSGTVGTYRDLKLRSLVYATAGTISITSGTNQRAGNATLAGGTVTVSNTTVTANTIVLITRKTAAGTLGAGGYAYTLSAGVSFTINSVDLAGVLSVLDTSTITYTLIEVP